MNNPIVLDSFALVCFFHKEPGWDKVKAVFYDLSSSGQKAFLSAINWGEFYYIVKRRVGKDRAEEALALLEQLPITITPVDNESVKEAAEIKSDFPVSFADASCIALAQRFNGQILTNDPEYESVQHLVTVSWLAKNKGIKPLGGN